MLTKVQHDQERCTGAREYLVGELESVEEGWLALAPHVQFVDVRPMHILHSHPTHIRKAITRGDEEMN